LRLGLGFEWMNFFQILCSLPNTSGPEGNVEIAFMLAEQSPTGRIKITSSAIFKLEKILQAEDI